MQRKIRTWAVLAAILNRAIRHRHAAHLVKSDDPGCREDLSMITLWGRTSRCPADSASSLRRGSILSCASQSPSRWMSLDEPSSRVCDRYTKQRSRERARRTCREQLELICILCAKRRGLWPRQQQLCADASADQCLVDTIEVEAAQLVHERRLRVAVVKDSSVGEPADLRDSSAE